MALARRYMGLMWRRAWRIRRVRRRVAWRRACGRLLLAAALEAKCC
ncbi:hypothetical protein E1A91_D08G173500v1 [Gossypium mustelinum]|uniref:Uncharacterized protein n=1 Tax=Gossypium mustelinum TaxID=34275 RepID=A0A5D2TYL3_GOSMU|nr:hypothetical protein E1A91_D08G173500v1 [Gossypium mustelinum]